MAGDLHRYFVEIPGASDEWWDLLADGVHDLWGERSLVTAGCRPCTGWSAGWSSRTGGGRRGRGAGGSCPRRPAPRDGDRLVVPAEVLDVATVDPAALALRDHERS